MTFQGVDLKGRQGIFLMDVRTGETTQFAGGPESDYLSWPAATPDGGNVVYTRNRSGKFTLVSRSVTTGEELDLFLWSHHRHVGVSRRQDGCLPHWRRGSVGGDGGTGHRREAARCGAG